MNKLITIALVVVLAIAGLLLGKVWWQNRNLDQANSQLNKELMQANLDIGRAKTEFGNAHKRIGELESDLQEEIRQRRAAITRIGELQAKLNAHGEGGGTVIVEGPTVEVPIPVAPGRFFWSKDENTLLTLGVEIPMNYKDHRLAIYTLLYSKNEKIMYSTEYDLTLNLEGQIVETLTPSGAVNNYINLWEIDDKGKRINKLQLTKFNVTVDDQRTTQFFWWAPHVDIGVSTHMAMLRKLRYGGSLGISIMGFGLTKNDLSWRFLRLSAEMQVQGPMGLGITPVLYNLGDPIPLISNVWIGPSIIVTGEKAIGLTLGAVL